LANLAKGLQPGTGLTVDVLAVELTYPQNLDRIEQRLRLDVHLGTLVNNAGKTIKSFLYLASDLILRLIAVRPCRSEVISGVSVGRDAPR